MTNFRYGFVTKSNASRLTPKSAFIRKLEASQRAATRKSTISVQIDLAKLFRPKASQPIEVVFDNFDLREAA